MDVFDCAKARLATLLRAGITFGDAAELATYAHDEYLPAAADYLRHGVVRNSDIVGFRQIRARLGGVSRAMYARQRKTFEDVLKLLPFASKTPAELVPQRRQLRKARAEAVSRR